MLCMRNYQILTVHVAQICGEVKSASAKVISEMSNWLSGRTEMFKLMVTEKGMGE